MVPIFVALAVAIDIGESERHRQATQDALDAAAHATARQIVDGASDAEARQFAQDFFEANLSSGSRASATIQVFLPGEQSEGLVLEADVIYVPYFLPLTLALSDNSSTSSTVHLQVRSEVQLSNTIEVALVLDNSGSMADRGVNSQEDRIDLLKEAAISLVESMAGRTNGVLQTDKPVQVAVVPFAASVNVGPQYEGAPWMDNYGRSIHHFENLSFWGMTTWPDRRIESSGDVKYKRGSGWGAEENTPFSRFSLFRDIKAYKQDGSVYSPYSWAGCVEARRWPHNVEDTEPWSGNTETYFMPLFAPDEPGNYWVDTDRDGNVDSDEMEYDYKNSYLQDWYDSNNWNDFRFRMKDLRKYFVIQPYEADRSDYYGPNYRCDTDPLTPLTDISVRSGFETVKDAIEAMEPGGDTNVPEGIAWGWRLLSAREPFTEGRPSTEPNNIKIIVVLTDGSSNYDEAPGDDPANLKSKYGAHGYTGIKVGGPITRILRGTSLSREAHGAENYKEALSQHLDQVCSNAKEDKIMIVTVALDIENDDEAVEDLENCASDSPWRKNADGSPEKLFFNTRGGDLFDVFEEIGIELKNLRLFG